MEGGIIMNKQPQKKTVAIKTISYPIYGNAEEIYKFIPNLGVYYVKTIYNLKKKILKNSTFLTNFNINLNEIFFLRTEFYQTF